MFKVIIRQKSLSKLFFRVLKWHINYSIYRKPNPIALSFYITDKCNLKCSFCNIRSKPVQQTLDEKKAFSIVEECSKRKLCYFSITGGEPLLVPYIFDLLKKAKNSKILYVHLVTNGTLLTEENCIRLKETKIDEISISIDGTGESHNKKRGLENAFEKTLAGLENISRICPELKIVINTIYDPNSPEDVLAVLNLARNKKLLMKVQPINKHPDFSGNTDSGEKRFDLFLEALKKNRTAIIELINSKNIVNTKTFLKYLFSYFSDRTKGGMFSDKCIFGFHHLEILENGMVFPCLEGLNWKDGFTIDKSLDGILNSGEYLDTLNNLKKCKKCSGNIYICYFEPRIVFPIDNFIKYYLFGKGTIL